MEGGGACKWFPLSTTGVFALYHNKLIREPRSQVAGQIVE